MADICGIGKIHGLIRLLYYFRSHMKLDKINQILNDDGLHKNVEILTSVVFK